jgi:hypothetical protein
LLANTSHQRVRQCRALGGGPVPFVSPISMAWSQLAMYHGRASARRTPAAQGREARRWGRDRPGLEQGPGPSPAAKGAGQLAGEVDRRGGAQEAHFVWETRSPANHFRTRERLHARLWPSRGRWVCVEGGLSRARASRAGQAHTCAGGPGVKGVPEPHPRGGCAAGERRAAARKRVELARAGIRTRSRSGRRARARRRDGSRREGGGLRGRDGGRLAC